MRCPKCQAENRAGVKFCEECGARMEAVCPSCAAKIPPGKRFVNKRDIESHAALLTVDYYDTHTLKYPRIPFHAVFGEDGRLEGPISVSASLGTAGVEYTWSRDNRAEIEKGRIVKGETLTELAGKLNIDGATLSETVAGWNRAVKSESFKRIFSSCLFFSM